MRHFTLLLLLLWTLSISDAFSQISHGGSPADLVKLKSAKLQTDVVEMPPFVQPTKEDIQAQIANSRGKTLKFAKAFKVDFNLHNSGTWYTLGDGSRIWQLHIKSDSAKSLGVIFSKYNLPEGAMVFVYNPDQSDIQGGFNSLNNKKSETLPVMPVYGDELIVEYQEPADVAYEADLEIGQVNHDYIGIKAGQVLVGEFGSSDVCEINVACDADYTLEKRAVVKIIVDGQELGSGTLINNTSQDGTPYVLSATHIFEPASYSATTSLFIFNYETPLCSTPQIEGTREQSVAGATVRAKSPLTENLDIDFTLVELSVSPPDAYRPVYLGWDASASIPASTSVIHHPQGDVKKISHDDDSPAITTLVMGLDGGDTKTFFPQAHFQINQYESGVTEGGSSGSALLNPSKQIIGALSAGIADCEAPVLDYYYRLSKAWNTFTANNQQLKYWLDPENTGETSIGAYDPETVVKTKLFSNIDFSDEMKIVSLSGGPTGYMAGHSGLEYTRFVEKFNAENVYNLQGVYFVPHKGRYRGNEKLMLQIWSAIAGMPDTMIYEQEVLIKEWQRATKPGTSDWGKTGGYVVKYSYDDKQNYVQLNSEEVNVYGDFFVGFQIKYPATSTYDTLALYQTTADAGANTAYYYNGSSWQPFSAHPVTPESAALWIEAVGIEDIGVGTLENQELTKPSFAIYPNPVTHQSTTIQVNEISNQSTPYQIYSTSGQWVANGLIPSNTLRYNLDVSKLSKGVYFVVFEKNNHKEMVKLTVLE